MAEMVKRFRTRAAPPRGPNFLSQKMIAELPEKANSEAYAP